MLPLLLLLGPAAAAATNPAACIALHCPVQSVQCVAQPACRAALQVQRELGVMCCPGGVGNYKLHGLTSKKGFYHLCLLPFPPAARKTVKQRGTYTMYQIGSLLLHCLDTHKLEQTETLNKHFSMFLNHLLFIALLRLFLKNNKCDGFSISIFRYRSDLISRNQR